jgi:amino acid transporter
MISEKDHSTAESKAETGRNSASDIEVGPQIPIRDTGKLKESYGLWSLCAQAIVLPGSWAFAATALTIAIFGGGAPVAIWGTIGISVCLWIVVAILAELGSAFPSAAGCTYIAYKVAGPEWGHFCSYMTGAFHGLGGIFSPPAFLIVLSQLILTCAAIFHETYEPTRWQVFLLYQFWNIMALLVLLCGSRILGLLSALACKCSLTWVPVLPSVPLSAASRFCYKD